MTREEFMKLWPEATEATIRRNRHLIDGAELVPAVDAGRYSIPPFPAPEPINVAGEDRMSMSGWLEDVDLSRFERMERSFTIKVKPMGAVRMTRADSWKKRPCVLRYRATLNKIKEGVNGSPAPDGLFVRAYLPIAKSRSKKKAREMVGKPHRIKPDSDNILKMCMEIFGEDCSIWVSGVSKFWCLEGEERIELRLVWFYKKA